MNNWHQSQRGYFAGALLDEMAKDDSIYLLTGDLGFGMFDTIRACYPKRFINCGASEQAMLGIAVGLAQEGKKPFVYTITSFFLRAAETISLYLSHEGAAVRLVGSGRGSDYTHDGYSHDCTRAQEFITSCGIMDYYPEDKEQVPGMVKMMLDKQEPSFLSLRR
jgi:transketolase